MLKALIERRWLILEMTRRDVLSRYRGSVLGAAWPVLQPLLMLLVYTLVFSEVFKARWPGERPGSNLDAAVAIFTGMIVHGFLAECLTRGPTLVTSNPEFVKKAVFPLDILPWVTLGTAMVQAAICFVVLCVFLAMSSTGLSWTMVYAPVVMLPLVVFSLGLMWMLAALGAYLRDISQVMTFLASLLLFLSPVFYPLSALPEGFQAVVSANPLTFFIEEARKVVLLGRPPSWLGLIAYFAVSLPFAYWAHWWFESIRPSFDDVL